ncbi:uroporphyrinogen decarboxylase [Formosa sediminum]|uniref:Uroporphyrinogen decarboxylase n=1 Tax=Formosa sediminum TaxID=2594004 RepID=A0A516GLZ7_9FLAO|nr:uroporphyrinogen decarboxylase [Formosa sediminum]QDO92554.1 uroporphyrinogen decarboxylase [Formosa sediminum]
MDMLGISVTEWVGYLASFVLLVSFTMKDVTKLRIVNSVGCALFVVYGIMLDTSWPVVITNGSIMLINAYYLFLKKG